MNKRWLLAGLGAGVLVVAAATTGGGGVRNSDDSATIGEGGAPMMDIDDGSVGSAIDKALGAGTYAYAPGFDASLPAGKPGASGQTPSMAPAPPVSSRAEESARSSAMSTSAGGGANSGGGVANLAAPSDRKIVQTGSIRLQVDEVGGSFEEVGRVATAAGGFVASSSFSLQGEHQVASVTIRVPATQYQDVLAEVRRMGAKVESEASNASDVTEEYTDLSARLRTYEATELQLLEFLGRTTTISEVLQVQDRLNTTRAEIEQIKGRMSLLDKLTELATLTVHLRPVAAAANAEGTGVDLKAEISKAWDESLEFLSEVAAGVLSVVVFAWWTPIVAIPALVFGSRIMRSRPQDPRPAQAYD